LRESIGLNAEPDSEDFKKIGEVFDRAVRELKSAGAEIVDPITIPKIKELLAKRASAPGETDQSFANYYGRSGKRPFETPVEATKAPDFGKVVKRSQERFKRIPDPAKHYESLKAQDELMTLFLKVMADHKLDAIVHKAVEHQPTLIKDGIAPPFTDQKGAPHLNTFLVYVPTIVVPAGFTRDNLPAGVCFIGRPYDDGNLIKFAFAYEQATHHRRPPASTTGL
jgi:amidase